MFILIFLICFYIEVIYIFPYIPLKYAIKIIQYTKVRPKFGVLIVIVNFIYLMGIQKFYIKNSKGIFSEIIRKFLKYLLMILPLFFLNLNFYRILKIFYIITLVYFSKNFKTLKKQYSFFIIFLIFSIYWTIFDIYSSNILTRILGPLFL